MNNQGRQISEFPFSRENAETIKKLGRAAVKAQADLVAYMKTIGSDKTSQRTHLLFECSAVETEIALTELLENTFPELTPVDWGFSE